MSFDRGERASFTQDLQWLVLVAATYYLGAELAFAIGTLSDRIFAPFWPPNIVLMCALIIVPYRRWWLYILAVLPAHVAAELGVGMGWWQLLVAFATNCMFAVLSALGLRYLLAGRPWLGSFNNAVAYVLIAAVASPAVSALGGAFVRVAGGGDLANYWLYWQQWYIANALASLTLGAAFLSWIDAQGDWAEFSSRSRQGEALLLLAGLAVACVVAFKADTWTPRNFLPALLYLPLPLVLWAAVRFRTRGASAAILVLTVTSIALTSQAPTVFVRAEAEDNVLALQVFITAVAAPVLLLAASVNGLRRAEDTAAALARFVLSSQDEERRRVARSLHDSIAQNLLAASWMIDGAQSRLGSSEQRADESLRNILRQSIRDLRETSYLLHPPLLEDGGLPAEIQSLAMDYSQRTGIAVAVDVPDHLGRLPPQVELTTFRVVEEALANVRQHSGSATARVKIDRQASLTAGNLVLAIEDAGKGMLHPGHRAARVDGSGLGLARMHERLHSVGGRLEISSGQAGTVVRAFIPIAPQPIETDI